MENVAKKSAPENLIPLRRGAKRLGVTPGTLYRWKHFGQNLTFYKVGGGVKLDPEEIDRFIEESRIAPKEPAS